MSQYETTVECYAGRHYPDRPLAFRWKGRRLEVEDVERQWRSQGVARSSPILYHYEVRTAEGRFHLIYDSSADLWEITQGDR